MKRSTIAALGFVLVLGACSSDSKSASTTSSSSSSTASTPYGSTSSSSSSSSASSSSSVAAGPTRAIAELKAGQNAKAGAQILLTDADLAVYMYQPDGTSATSTVDAGIKSNWPAIVAKDPASLILTGIDPTLLSVKPQPDGTKQLAFNGHLLYGFVGDTAAGDANGQALSGVWFVLSPGGDKVG